ncbi:MAG: hypothetical protein ONB33_13520 [candidate division KSB1 bacterium]|nr:hypothetical protein [candidate division KSB1 bacterium]MDZ7358611.1 hypothetical protein [candidate division KSB1 bacterium]MDZ7399173.1 hypothetical protein [candidate division KSB1 bacterium]
MDHRINRCQHLIALIFLIALLPLFLIWPTLVSSNEQNVEARVWYFLQKYSPNSYYLVEQYLKSPRAFQLGRVTINLGEKGSLLRYIDGTSDSDIVGSLNTLVHEVCHGYTRTVVYQYLQQNPNIFYNFGSKYLLYYIDSLRSILVPQTPVFPTKEIHRVVPKPLRSLRYETYIFPSSAALGAQVDGIYGLLDEWNAYYHGTRTDIDLFDYYAEKAQKKPSYWLEFFSAVNGTYYAHVEFKFYTLKYLMLAREEYPQIYDQILANKKFAAAFLTIDGKFTDLIDQYFKLKSKVFAELRERNIEFSEDEDYVYIGNAGRGNFLKIYNQLSEELNKPDYQEMLSIIRSAAE